MAKKVQLMTNAKEWQVIDGVEVLVDVPQEDIDPITDSNCVEIEGHRTLEETISQENMFTPKIVETKVYSKVGGVYHDNVVDGAYEEAILYGNTQVNLVESVTTGAKYIPHSFTSFQGNESKIGNYHNGRTNQVAPLVKGVTMVNLVQEGNMTLEGGDALPVYNVKGNTEYTLKFTFTQKNSMAGIIIQSYKEENGTLTYLENSKLQLGLGDEVSITFTTHEQANRVHICNGREYGGETIQLDNIMVIEGDVTDLDLPFFKGMRSVELSRPLTNLFTDDLVPEVMGVTVTNSGGTVTVTSTTISQWASARYHLDLKPNTKYVIMWDGLTFTQTASGIDYIISVCENDTIFSHMGNKFTTLRSIIFDTGDKSAISIRIHATTSNSETGTTTVKGLRVFEWDDSLRTLDLQTIGYFSGTKYVSVRALETEGKNLYPYGDVNFTPTDDKVDNWYDAKGTMYMYGDVAQKSKSRFLLKKGTYTIRFGTWSNISAFQLIDDKETLCGKIQSMATPSTFTLEQDAYCTLRLKPTSKNVATTVTGIQIERGETATTYEAYQGRYYKPRETEEIILRSLPDGVCDTFNLQTGEYIQRIGEAILDGSEVWTQNGSFTNFFRAYCLREVYLPNAKGGIGGITDTFPTYGYNQTDVDSDDVDTKGLVHAVNELYIKVPKSYLTSEDVDGLKQWLSQNPITVQYELKEPIITKLQTYARVYNAQTNALAHMSNNISALTYRYSTDYLKVGNLSPVPAILEPITTIPYDVRLKPSTLYTVKYNRGGYSNSMKFDLGGSIVEKTNATDLGIVAEEFTVKTPAILSHEQLILSGTGYAHNFIVVEGDITGTELPYFEGMKDVKMPIVKNIGKNLFDIQSIYQGLKNIEPNNVLLLNDNTLQIKSTAKWHKKDLGKPIKFKENTRYTLSFNAQDINNVGGLPDTVICFAYIDGTSSFNRVWGDNVFTSTAGKTVDYIEFSFGFGDGRMIEFSNFMLVEGTEAQLYEPYKENSVYAVQGEYPITSEMIEQGGFSTGNPNNDGSYETMKYGEENINYLKRLRSKDLIPVKPNTTYAFAHSFSKFIYNVYQWNGNKRFIDGTPQKFANGQVETITTTADTQYIHFLMSKDDISQNITVAEYDWSQFHMYELDSTINLRSLPNGVKDELNLLTGEYIQRVGEVVFDGSDDEDWNVYADGDFALIPFFHVTFFNWLDGGSCANKYHNAIKISSDGELGYCIYGNGVSNSIPRAILRVRTNEIVNGLTIESWKEELKISPLILQYELAEPIISHVRLVSNNQEREVGVKLPNGVCNTYNPSTGITTVRVGKVVLDGSEDWKNANNYTNTYRFKLVIPDARPRTGIVTDGMYIRLHDQAHGEYEYIINFDDAFYLNLYKTELTVLDVSGVKEYLSQNPITVWYELNYPQIQPDIVLPNGVHDEYNPETGVYTKKVGFVELDGSEHWVALSTAGYFYTEANDVLRSSDYTKTMICDGLPIAQTYASTVSGATLTAYPNNDLYPNENWIYIIGSSYTTKDELISSLSQNPLKVWYELATPITYQLTPYFGLPQPYAYEDGYLIHESAYGETTLPPEFKYKLVANRTGQIVQNGRKLQEHTTRLSNLEALIIEATIQSLFDRELQLFELELMDIQLIDLGE